jgi:DNA-directed RNA polymerase subunit M/transcription elongation factor TFIIS
METIDHTNEYRRLEELYAEMSDSRLQEMADRVGDLTDLAQQVLRAEISRRGLDKRGPAATGKGFFPAEDELVGIWRVKDTAEAKSVMDVLESAGIPASLGTEKIEIVGGGFENELTVEVLPESRYRALEKLHQAFPQEPEPEEDVERVAVCPNCHSPDIVFQGLDSEPAPDTPAKYNWTCDACGHQWKDNGLEQLA